MWTEAVCKELNSMEAWYDAEEDLEPAERGQDPAVINKDVTKGKWSLSSPLLKVLLLLIVFNVMQFFLLQMIMSAKQFL